VGAAVGAESRDDPGTAVGLAAAEVEIDDLLGQVAELEAAAGELDPVGVGAPVAAGIAEEDEGDQGDSMPLTDAVLVVVKAPGQVGIALHLDLEMDEQPLLAAMAQTDLDELVGAQRAPDSVGDQGSKLLLQRDGLDGPVDEGGDPW
jgi:hypothetical protein